MKPDLEQDLIILQRNTSHVWNVTIPTAGGNQPVDQMQSMFNTLTTIYAG